MRNEEKKDIFDFSIIRSSVLGIGVILSISVAFNIKVTVLSILLGVMIGGLMNSFVNILIINAQQKELKFRCEIDILVADILKDHQARIKKLEDKIKELEEGRQ